MEAINLWSAIDNPIGRYFVMALFGVLLFGVMLHLERRQFGLMLLYIVFMWLLGCVVFLK